MTDPGLEAPIGPVLGGPRLGRERARIVVVGLVAIVVLAAGIGLVGNGVIDPTASSSPSSSAGAPSDVARASTLEPSLATASGPTPVPSTCALVPPGHPWTVAFRLQAGGGGPVGVEGIGPSASPSNESNDVANWPVPSTDVADRLGIGEGVVLIADLDSCVQFVSAEYRAADPSVPGPFPIAWHTMEVSPPRPVVPLGPLPEGDWIVRITATFLEFQAASPAPPESTERFFRVIVGSGVRPSEPPPEVLPAVACVPWDDTVNRPDLVLTGTDDGTVPGIAPGTGTPPLTYGNMGSPIEIRATGDACALAWSISAQNIDTNRSVAIESQDNATFDPFVASQNRWLLRSVPTGLLEMTATMHFSADVTVSRRWALIVQAPDFPEVLFRASDGTEVTGTPSCGSQWEYLVDVAPSGKFETNATGGEVSCTGNPILGDVPELATAPGSVIRVEAPGWTVGAWAGACGTLDPSVSQSAPFIVSNGCDLGGSGIGPAPIAFVSRASATVVRLDLTLYRDNGGGYEQVGGSVYVSIVPTAPTRPLP